MRRGDEAHPLDSDFIVTLENNQNNFAPNRSNIDNDGNQIHNDS